MVVWPLKATQKAFVEWQASRENRVVDQNKDLLRLGGLDNDHISVTNPVPDRALYFWNMKEYIPNKKISTVKRKLCSVHIGLHTGV